MHYILSVYGISQGNRLCQLDGWVGLRIIFDCQISFARVMRIDGRSGRLTAALKRTSFSARHLVLDSRSCVICFSLDLARATSSQSLAWGVVDRFDRSSSLERYRSGQPQGIVQHSCKSVVASSLSILE